MIYLKSMLNVIDNSGALMVECIKVLGKKPKNCARIGDRIVVVVQKARPISNQAIGGGSGGASSQKIRQGDMRHAVVVRTKQLTQRPDGSVIRFDDNACVLIDNQDQPVGTRVAGVVARELRKKGFNKVVSLAPRTV